MRKINFTILIFITIGSIFLLKNFLWSNYVKLSAERVSVVTSKDQLYKAEIFMVKDNIWYSMPLYSGSEFMFIRLYDNNTQKLLGESAPCRNTYNEFIWPDKYSNKFTFANCEILIK